MQVEKGGHFVWVGVNPTMRNEFSSALEVLGFDYMPQDLLVGINVNLEDFKFRGRQLWLLNDRLMKEVFFPKIITYHSPGYKLNCPFAIVGLSGLILSQDDDPKQGILFARHREAKMSPYKVARDMLLSDVNRILQKTGRSLFPDYKDRSRWIYT